MLDSMTASNLHSTITLSIKNAFGVPAVSFQCMTKFTTNKKNKK